MPTRMTMVSLYLYLTKSQPMREDAIHNLGPGQTMTVVTFWKPVCSPQCVCFHDDVIKWKHFPRYWPFVRGIHRSPVNSPHKGQWRGTLMFTLICARINGWVNNREAGDLRRHCVHYDVIVMYILISISFTTGASYIRDSFRKVIPLCLQAIPMQMGPRSNPHRVNPNLNTLPKGLKELHLVSECPMVAKNTRPFPRGATLELFQQK